MQQDPTIYIIGAGAIGRPLAVFLHAAGRRVQLIRGRIDNGSERMETITVETANGETHEATLTIKTLQAFDSLDGIIVLATKSYGNSQLAAALKEKVGQSPVVLLQNGLGVEQPFIHLHFPAVYRCVLFVSSQEAETNKIRFKPVDHRRIGIETGNMAQLDMIVRQMNTPAFRFMVEEQIQPIIWKKAIINSVFNSVCPLLDIDNGIFHRDASALHIARSVIAECLEVATAKGIILDAADVEQTLLQISRSSDGQLIPTLQDIRKGLPTEIDTLNKEIVRMAHEVHLQDRVPQTDLLGQLTSLKAQLAAQGT